MPKLVDYAGRFEFLRQAAHAVVRDEGVAGLSRRAVAARLELAPATVRRALGAGPVDRALHALRTLLPSPPAMEHELVWWRLVLAQPSLSQRAAGAAREAARVRHTEDNEEWYAELDLADRRAWRKAGGNHRRSVRTPRRRRTPTRWTVMSRSRRRTAARPSIVPSTTAGSRPTGERTTHTCWTRS